MARGFRYVDAVRLLGGQDPAIRALDTLLGVGTLGVWDLIEVKNELIKVGNDLLGRWRDWRADKVWRSRTERLEAAHAILAVTAYLEALGRLELPVSLKSFSKDEQRTVFGMREIPCPAPHRPFERNVEEVAGTYQAFNGSMIDVIEVDPESVDIVLRLPAHGRLETTIPFQPDPLLDRRSIVDLVMEAEFCYDIEQMALIHVITPFFAEVETRGRGAPLRGLFEVLSLRPDNDQERVETYIGAIGEWSRSNLTPLVKAILGDLALTTGAGTDEIIASVSHASEEAAVLMQQVARAMRVPPC
ncbi:hypothetical protein [Nonomuraea sp. NPDC049784]|uniref:NACHT N-terminal helical domain 7-containing protein n=1 Tax=Nonomuraea sp. NPDC049784 TaxID=3154361 RepID=UPI0033CF8ED2